MNAVDGAALGVRRGLGYWWSSYRAMLHFDWGRTRAWAGLAVIIQTMMGAGMAMTYGFFYPSVTPLRAALITTGAPALALIPLGLVMVPGMVAQDRIAGTFDYIWSLPAPRSAQAVASFSLQTFLALPGAILALVLAAWRYDVHLAVSPLAVPGFLLCSLAAVAIGYSMALAMTNPMVVNVVINALIFLILLFSPIVYPASQLPRWFRSVHRVLPFEHMATVIRAGLSDGLVQHLPLSFAVLSAWALGGALATAWLVHRRP